MKQNEHKGLKSIAYNVSETIRIIGHTQIAAYWLNGVIPLEIYPSRDFNTGKPILVGVFYKEDTKEVFDKWVKHELN